MKILTVASYKGGVGKSTTAIHLATYFSDQFKVLLIDGDVNRSCIEWSERGKLPFTVADERKAVRLIPEHELIVIDTAARPRTDDLKELAEEADLLVLPTIPDVLSMTPMLQTAEALKGISEKVQYRALITANPPSPSTDGKVLRDELRDDGVPVFETMIRRSLGFGKAALEGIPLRDLKRTKQRLAWIDYEKLGQEIEAIWLANLPMQ
jgi:chromosome partitioning protein